MEISTLDAETKNSAPALVDKYRRTITYLRLSITDRCDLRCTYCMPERMKFLPRSDLMTFEEMLGLSDAFIARGIDKIRITGGEPLVRRGAIDFLTALGTRLGEGLNELTLTTNGTMLEANADALYDAGVRRINVSLDTRSPELFQRLTRRDKLADVLSGLEAAKRAGLQVKINTVALRGLNDVEISSLIEWAHGEGFALTLIEAMPLGEIDEDRSNHYLPLDAVRDSLRARWTLEPLGKTTGGPARYVRVVETGGELGFITPLTQNFCAGCNRIRVTATGRLYPCLGGGEHVDLRDAWRTGGKAAIGDALDEAMRVKPERHHFAIAPGSAPAQPRHMSMTGG